MANEDRHRSLAPGPDTHIHDRSEIELGQYIVEAAYDQDEDHLKPRHQYYKSEKILGKLYRAVDERKIWQENVRFRPAADPQGFWMDFTESCLDRCEDLGYDISPYDYVEEASRIRLV